MDDPGWLRQLEEFDEPPLFNAYKDVAFLCELPEPDRGSVLFEAVAMELNRVALKLNNLDSAASFFLCLTFHGWDELRLGAVCVPTVSLLISPQYKTEIPAPRWKRSASAEAMLVEQWKDSARRPDLDVLEGCREGADEPLRIYVGFKPRAYRFRSIGDYPLPGALSP